MIDRYKIIKLIYKDELGGIYLAKDNLLPREVYFRNFNFSPEKIQSSKDWKEKFLLHAEKITSTKHSNLLAILDFFIDEQDPILISEVLDSDLLSEHINKGAFSIKETLQMAKDLLSALSAAHAAELYHGEMHTNSIKVISTPENTNQYKIIDLGITTLSSLVREKKIHLKNSILLPPEYYKTNFKPNASSDLFMIGQLCYTVLAGGHPFANHKPEECIEAYEKGEIPDLTIYNTKVPETLKDWITRLIDPEPTKRYLSAKEALTTLKELEKNIIPTPKKKTQPTVITPSVTPTQNKPVENPYLNQAPQKKTASKIFIGIAAILILSATTYFLIPQSKLKEKKTHYNSTRLGKVSIVNKTKKSPVSISLDTPNITDWLVITGSPASESNKRKENGRHFINITKIGSFKEFKPSNTDVNFTLNKKQIPSGSATTNRHNAEENNGWEIILQNPQPENQAITLNLYLTQANCDVSVSLKNLHKSSSPPINFDIPYTKSGIVKIPIHIPKIPPKKIFTLSILSKKIKPKENFTIGLNAITIENL